MPCVRSESIRSVRWGCAALISLLVGACSASTNDDSGAAGGGAGGGGGKTGTGGTGKGGGTSTGGNSGTGAGIAIGGSGGGESGGAGGAPVGGGGAAGSNPCSPPNDTPAPSDSCGNGLDDNLNGFVDEGCQCTIGQTQPCFGGTPSQSTLPNCTKGTQTCQAVGEFGQWGKCEGWTCGAVTVPEICNNNVDDDCDGLIDEGCALTVPVNIDGDCIAAYCPPQAPFPVGCNITMEGGDSRGCVANAIGNSGVYFQEGDECPNPLFPFGDVGHISGTLLCSSQPPTTGLNETNCPINKATKFYPNSPAGCP